MKTKSLRVPAIVVTVICISILGFVLYCKSKWDYDCLTTIIYPLVEMICSITITGAIGTYFIEWKGFVDFIKEKLSEILSSPSMIKNLSTKYQHELLRFLIRELNGIENDEIDNFTNVFFKTIKEQTDNFGYYLVEQKNTVQCDKYKDEQGNILVDSQGNQYRILHHIRSITYGKLNNKKVYIQDILSVNTLSEKLFDGNSPVTITSVKINSQTLSENEYSLNDSDNNDTAKINTVYKKRFVCSLTKPQEITEGLRIDIEYSTITPLSDYTYCTRMKLLCKRYILDFNYNPNEFEIHGQSFSFGKREYQTIKTNSINLDINKWILPGEGTDIFIGGKE